MPLPLIVETLETVAEPLRANYTKTEDGKFRLDLEGYEDPVGLKSALDKERKAAKEAARQSSQWASLGKTPEEIQSLIEAQRKAEEEKAVKGGEWEKLKQQMNEAAQKERAQLEQKLQSKDKAIERYLIDAQATTAIADLKGSSALLLPHVKAAVRVVEDAGEFAIRVVDSAGNPRVNGKGEFLTIKDLVSEMRQSDIYAPAFASTGSTGGGASGGGSSAAKTITDAQFQALPPKERAARMKEGYKVI
jgi:DNA-binding transcriptional MerR regulator